MDEYIQCPLCGQTTLEHLQSGGVHCTNEDCVPMATMSYEELAALTPEQQQSYRTRRTASGITRRVVADEELEAIMQRNAQNAANRGINERLFG